MIERLGWDRLLAGRFPRLRDLPGPEPAFPLGNLRDLRGMSAREASIELARRYGPFTRVWLANQPVVWVHDPDAIAEMVGEKSAYFTKDEPLRAFLPGLGAANAFTENGASWRQTRRDGFLSDPRAPQWLEQQWGPARDLIGARLARDLPMRDAPNFEDWLYRLVFDLTSVMVLGRTLPDEAFHAYNRVMDAIDFRLSTMLPVLPPGFGRAKRTWHGFVDQAFEAARGERSGASMAHLVARHSALPRGSQAPSLADLFPGGVWSVMASIAAVLTQLSAHPEHLREVRGSLVPAPDAYAEASRSVPLERTLRESMRIASSVPVFMRRVRELEVTVGSLALDPTVRVIVGSAGLHHDARRWPEPEAFRPERWTDEVLAENPFGSGYLFPFGRGPRACHGQEFALFQIRAVVVALLTRPGGVVVKGPREYGAYFGVCMPKGLEATLG